MPQQVQRGYVEFFLWTNVFIFLDYITGIAITKSNVFLCKIFRTFISRVIVSFKFPGTMDEFLAISHYS
jgi:hypothetical protein